MAAAELLCWRCGASLAALTLPLSRRDGCPACTIDLHVCRMCEYYDPAVPKQCREDDAEEVTNKDRVNFCEWFRPTPAAFDPARAAEASRAENRLASLFGEGEADPADGDDDALDAAEDLFR